MPWKSSLGGGEAESRHPSPSPSQPQARSTEVRGEAVGSVYEGETSTYPYQDAVPKPVQKKLMYAKCMTYIQ